jgi:plastocyanin
MRTATFFFACSLLFLCACSSKNSESASPSRPQTQAATKVDPATAATVSGVIKFAGTPPKPQKIDMSMDPACGKQANFDESYVVNHGDLANVFVYIKSGSPPATELPAEPPKIEQQGCRYHPHVLGVMVGEPVHILNDDDTTHNIHPMPTQSKQWNESQMPKAEPIVKKFDKPELMIPIKCNQHPWMKMYLSVVATPWFAVTDENGKFAIKGLPPGDYTLAAVHEKLGEQEMKISVAAKDSKTADFTFKAQ